MTRSLSTTLKAHYALGTTSLAQCWKATLQDGTVIAATSHTEPLVIDGVTYQPTTGFNASDLENGADLSVDNLEVDGYLASPAITKSDVHTGRWDYAAIELFEVNFRDLTMGKNIIRSGTLGQVKAGRSIFTAELRGLTQKYSRRIVQLTTQECTNDLGDARCGIDLADWTVFGSVDHVSQNQVITDATRTEAAEWFTGGLLTFLTGRNAGQSFEVKSYSPGSITLFEQPANLITAADTPAPPISTSPSGDTPTPASTDPDTYSMYAGCQKRFYQDCIGKFDNALNFRGFPHLPGVGVFGGPGTTLTPITVPGSGTGAPTPPPSPAPAPGPAPAPTPAPGPGSVPMSSTVGTYAVTLPTAGPSNTSTPATTDASGSATLTSLIAATTGSVISIPAGIYVITSAVAVPAGKTLEPVSGAAVVLKAGNGFTGSMLTPGSGSTIRNFTVDGNYANRSGQEGDTAAAAITLSGGSGVTIQNMKFVNTPSTGVWVYNSPSLAIKYNVFLETWQAIRIDGNNLANTGTIEGNTFTNTTAFKSIQHITAINTDALQIKHNTFAGAGLAEPTTHGFEGTWGNSIYIFNSDGYLVENNTVGQNYWSAIGAGQNSTNATIQRNSFSHGAHGGTTGGLQSSWIEQVGADTITFTRNSLVGGLSVGDTGGDHLTITNNLIKVPVGGTGIDCNSAFKHGTISLNTIQSLGASPSDTGIYLWDKSTPGIAISVTYNAIKGFDNGIGINNPGSSGTVYGLTVTNNTYLNCNTNVLVPGAITVDASCTIETTSAPGGFATLPFGSRPATYASGVLAPTDSTANMDAFIKSQYDRWVANILKSTSVTLGSIPAGGYWVQKSAEDLTVSEGMGYGMLITVLMAGYDGQAQTKFDGLLKTVKAFPSNGGTWSPTIDKLMSWRVKPDGTDGGGAWPALDGDLDIALACLMADAQWGSTGTYNYFSEALAMIAQIKAYGFDAATGAVIGSNTLLAGRTSDYMIGHFRAFATATGDSFWTTAVHKQKAIIEYLQVNYAPGTGLLPDWAGGVKTTSPYPTTDVSDGFNPNKDQYWYNACRDPWRLGTDYALTGDADIKRFLTRMSTFFENTTGGTVTNIINGYSLAGGLVYDQNGPVVNNPFWIASEFYNPMMLGAMADARFQTWLNALWTFSKAHPETGYYGTEIQLLCAIVASGNWWTP